MADFKDLLAKPAAAVERPKALPMGTYQGIIVGHEFGESTKKKTPYVRHKYRLTAPCEDVPMDQFEERGGQALMSKKIVNEDFYITDDALFRLTDHYKDHLKMDTEGKSVKELIPLAVNLPVKIFLKEVPSQRDPTLMYNEIGSFAPID